MPSEWIHPSTAKTPANTPHSSPPVHSRIGVLHPVLFTGPLRSYTLDSDDDGSSTSQGDIFTRGVDNEDDAQSTHSSEIYYNSSLDLAIEEHIRKDDEALRIINAFGITSV